MFNPAYYKTDLKYRVSYARQLFKHWHLLNFITPYSNILDIGSGNCDVGRLIEDNDLSSSYYPVDITIRGDRLPRGTTPIELNLCIESLEDKIKELKMEKKFNVIVIYDFLQNINYEYGKKIMLQVSNICNKDTIVSVCFRTGKYVQDYEEKMFLSAIDWKEFKMFLKEKCNFQVINTYGLRYGECCGAIRELSNTLKPRLFKKINSFLPDEIARNVLGIC
jgi:hypothetical protein